MIFFSEISPMTTNKQTVLERKTADVLTTVPPAVPNLSYEITAMFFCREIPSSWEGSMSADEE